MRPEDAVEAALKTVGRNDDGSVDEKELIDEVARLIDFDEDDERRQKASRLVSRRRKPGTSPGIGQLILPGMDPYAYEPDRLVADDDGRVIEQRLAPPGFKNAEAARARVNARAQQQHADRKTAESEAYSSWTIQQLTAGRDPKTITYGAFVHEAGLWSE